MVRSFVLSALVVLLVACNPKREETPATASAEAPEKTADERAKPKKQYVASDIVYAYHGLLLDRDRNIIPTDRETLERMQDSLLQSLQAQPEAVTFEGVKQLRRAPALDRQLSAQVMSTPNLEAADRWVLKSALIQQGIRGAAKQEREQYQWRFNLIHERLLHHVPRNKWTLRNDLRVRLSPEIQRLIRELMTPRVIDYVAQCRAEDVPIPPVWPTGEGWANRGMLPYQFNFLQSGPDTEVWTYEAPSNQGICYLLPRKTGNVVGLAGLICQSKRTGKACFWDNIDATTGLRIEGEGITLNVANLKNGSNLSEVCTDCHRGGNVFLVHPTTPLGLGANRDPDVRYSPIGKAEFVNPPAMADVGDGACSDCHEIGAPHIGYCGVLANAADKTMPSTGNPANWNTPRAAYAAHVAYLKGQCGGV